MRLIPVSYYGFTAMDRRFSSQMLPWIVSEIRKRDSYEKLSLGIEDGFLQAYNSDFEVQYAHKLSLMTRFSQADMDPCTFLYLLRDDADQLLYCYLYQASKPPDVLDLYQQMKDNSNSNPAPVRSLSTAANLTSLCVDISPSSSNFFEVLYIGKIKVWNRKVPDTFIDDALEKFKAHDVDKSRRKLERLKSESNLRRGSIDSQATNRGLDRPFLQRSQSVITNLGVKSPDIDRQNLQSIGQISEDESKENSPTPCEAEKNVLNGSTISLISEKGASEQNEPDPKTLRLGAASIDDHNRTMVLQVDRTDLRLISPDRKVILLHKHHKDVTTCIQGLKNSEHFGFICKETNNLNTFIGYVFKCESASVASEAVGAISQSFSSAEIRSKNMVASCEHCPMVWYHKLCCEIENMTDKKTQVAIMRKIEQLDYEEQDVILTKFRGVETDSLREQNEFLMMLLRAHCEMKQGRHIHDTPESRSEFLNQYLGGSTIFMKAKRSLTTSFDNLLKRRASKDDFNITSKDMSLPINPINPGNRENSPNNTEASDSEGSRSSTAGSQNDLRESQLSVKDSRTPEKSSSLEKNLKSPMMDIFLKVGSSPKSSEEYSPNKQEIGSWRQAIFKTVVTPSKPTKDGQKRTRAELRELWKNSIHQAVLLVRMEKENARLKASQEETAVKRIKLEYDELRTFENTNTEIWDLISNKDTKIKYDHNILLNIIRQGIPRGKRGDVWNFVAEEFTAHLRPVSVSEFPNFNVTYETLLRQLTSHQHAILIDLGRTFPAHSYYSSPLGPGQLALFNLLKAYSLLDPEVGYCQGLSFVAGVLLLHMEESQAFSLLRHLMFRRDLRKQYLPDMVGLQIRLYQLSRLLHDQLPELYEHFDAYEVAPTLYAAPWLLTIFASQFPLGFVTRVFDLMFLESPDVVFRVALALLSHHKDELLACDNFEEIMNFLKVKLPAIEKPVLEKVMNQVYTTDISKQLHEYQVEYHVLQEEMQSVQPHVENLQKLEQQNKALTRENQFLATQLEISVANNQRLEKTRGVQQTQLNQLKMQNRGLDVTVSTLASFINNRTDMEIPGEIRRILAQITTAERQKTETKNNFLNNMFRKTGNERVMVKSLSTGRLGIRNIPNIDENQETTGFFSKSYNQILNQRRLSEAEEVEPSLPLGDKVECDKSSPTNSIDSGVETPVSPNHHPLSSCDVNFTYNGTKELKKIGSLRTITRAASVDIVGK